MHSLAGAVALGTFLVAHLLIQSQLLSGWGGYDSLTTFGASRAWLLAEALLLYVPLLFHAAYGLSIVRQRRVGLGRYPYRKSWAWLLQRVTGAIALLFILFHTWQFRIQIWLGHMAPEDLLPALCASLSSTWWGVPITSFAYVVGSGACIIHFCNGLSGFCFLWGITRTRRAIRITSWALGALGLLLTSYAFLTIMYLATGSTALDLVR